MRKQQTHIQRLIHEMKEKNKQRDKMNKNRTRKKNKIREKRKKGNQQHC